MSEAPNPLRPRVLLWRGATLRCPVCGRRGVVHRWVSLRERCPVCGFAFERSEGHSLGYIGLNTMVTFTAMFVLLVALLFATYPQPPAARIAVVCAAFAVLFPVLFLPFARTLWTAIDLCMTPLEVGEVDPGWELEQYGED